MLELLSCAGLFVGAYVVNLVFSPTFRKMETEDAARTGCGFHAFAWGATLLIVFAVIAAGLVAFSALLPGD